ncbi:MAG: DUF5060 domain-containing protein [Nibricoccus sp.]
MTLFTSILRTSLLSLALVANLCLARATAPTSVEKWGVFEIELKGPTDGNPFVDVTLSAEFSNGHRMVNVPGFYDGNGVYRIRFMPEETGNWTYFTHSNRWPLTQQRGDFTVTAPTKGNRGPVRVANTYHFAYADGTPYKQIGTTCYTWTHRPAAVEEQTLKTLAASPFNKIRMCVFPQTHGMKTMPPTRFPFMGEPTNPDYTRFNPEFFQHLEKRISQLRELGIECDLLLFHPYDDDHIWKLDTMPPAVEDFYVRYIVARLSAYRNIWWSMANEYDYVRTKTEADWDRNFQVVQASDPYNHLRSIHNGKVIYDHNKPWVTHVSMQNGSAVEEVGRALLYRDVYRKPIVYDEIVYEGNHRLRWAQIDGRELTHRFWVGTVAGTYVGHSEYLITPDDPAREVEYSGKDPKGDNAFVWIGQGGVLRGECPPRLAFLRKILEDSPATGIDPIDKWWTVGMGGKPGEYYLVYFGREKPTSWKFELYRDGIADGNQFKIEVIDTWDMTITPVEGVFVAKKKDMYTFIEEKGRSVTLPGKPNIALRIRRVSGVAGEISDKPPGN